MQLLGHLASASTRFSALLREASPAIDAGAVPAVPGCPGWDLTDLAAHLGGVHRWALDALDAGDPARPPAERAPSAPAGSEDLCAWFEEGAEAIRSALGDADPGQPCWGFGPKPRTASFWQRRVPHETTLHAWDAARALGHADPLDPELAADGVDEVVTMFVPRQVRLSRLEPAEVSVELRATDAPGWGPWLLAPAGEVPDAPDAVVSAPAATLLLLLWRREPFDAVAGDGGVTVGGDAGAVRTVLALPLTP